MKATTLPSPRRHELPGAYGPGSHDLLTAEQEVELGRLVVAGLGERRGAVDWSFDDLEPGSPGRQAAETLVLMNVRLVRSIVRRYPPGGGRSFDDAVQDGLVGLMRAVLKFDPEAGNKFSTYATWWIRQAIGRAACDEADLVRLPVHMHEKLSRVRRYADEHGTDLEHLAATCPDGLPEVDVDGETLRLLWRWDHPTSPLDDVGLDGSGSVLLWRSTDPPPLDEHGLSVVLSVMAGADSRAPDMVTMRFGLDGEGPRTLQEIGDRYGITREWARQIEVKALAAARSYLTGLDQDDWAAVVG